MNYWRKMHFRGDTMTIKFEFDFDDQNDFVKFTDKHASTINAMGQGEDRLTDQIKRQVDYNNQLPENFEFTDQQYAYMLKNHKSGMQRMVEDNRVSVKRNRDERG